MELAEEVLKGSVRAVSKLISLVENKEPGALAEMQKLYPHTGKAYIIGITGPSGSGKSTLAEKVTQELRLEGFSMGIIAVDPTSPFTGGALLGDRIRMQQISGEDGVFIRSLATRGTQGGLSRATFEAAQILDAFGKDFILIETVGVGQDEVEIVKTVDTCLVVMVPGLGDDIQTLKAGIMEIADIFVVNKADREGVERLVTEIRMMLGLLERSPSSERWTPPVVKTVATQGKGISDLIENIKTHRRYLLESNKLEKRRKERTRAEIIKMVEEEISQYVRGLMKYDLFDELIEEIASRKKEPYSYVKQLVAKVVFK